MVYRMDPKMNTTDDAAAAARGNAGTDPAATPPADPAATPPADPAATPPADPAAAPAAFG